jgi:hypothetical protein
MFDSHEQMRFGGFMAMSLKMTANWDVTHSLVDNHHFEGNVLAKSDIDVQFLF